MSAPAVDAEPATAERTVPRAIPRFRAWVARAPLRLFALFLVLTFATFAAWSIATPLFASPDEPTQVARAAALVRGQLVGRTIGSVKNARTAISIPRAFVGSPGNPTCFAFNSSVPASCAPPQPADPSIVPMTTYSGRYPPFYYAVVGLPSLVAVSSTGIYLMRLVSGLMSAVMIALALMSVVLWSRSRLLLVGVVAATTPMVWFLGGVVNPNGLEASAAICAWTAGAVLLLERPEHPPTGLVAVLAASLGVLMLTRPLSALWAAVIVAVLALAGGWRSVAAVLRSGAVRLSIAVLAPCGGFAVWWVVAEHSLDLVATGPPAPRSEGSIHLLSVILGHTATFVHQMVGVFGWLNTFPPELTYLVWFVVIGLLALGALLRTALWPSLAAVRRMAVLVLLGFLVVAVPTAVIFSQAHRLGIVWQGRDGLPLAVGVPVMSAALAGDAPVVRRYGTALAALFGVAIVAAEVAAFFDALRRYTVGASRRGNAFAGPWQPPLGALPVFVWECLAIALLAAVLSFFFTAQTLTDREPVTS